jgi:hypothetical protein
VTGFSIALPGFSSFVTGFSIALSGFSSFVTGSSPLTFSGTSFCVLTSAADPFSFRASVDFFSFRFLSGCSFGSFAAGPCSFFFWADFFHPAKGADGEACVCLFSSGALFAAAGGFGSAGEGAAPAGETFLSCAEGTFLFSSASIAQTAFHMKMRMHSLSRPIRKHTGKSTPECTVYKYGLLLYTSNCAKRIVIRGGNCEE